MKPDCQPVMKSTDCQTTLSTSYFFYLLCRIALWPIAYVAKMLASNMLAAKLPRTLLWILDVARLKGGIRVRVRGYVLGREKEALVFMIKCCALESSICTGACGRLFVKWHRGSEFQGKCRFKFSLVGTACLLHTACR